ncbi:hypothetical protein ABDK00_001130 [Niabella insulamsoli]|uniref:hypothetical protein n=1 Tax=Niabella insulamsoli TaxID=3144874 RepID=UPI0031FD481E
MKQQSLSLLFMLVLAFAMSCSKDENDLSSKEDPIEATPSPQDSDSLSAQAEAYKKAIIGHWVLYKLNSDMGPVDFEHRYARSLTFSEDFVCKDSTVLFNSPQKNITSIGYKIDLKNKADPGYNPYIIIERKGFYGFGVFLNAATDTLFVFNGVGSEYYRKVR